jgi:hypothetical protein
LFTLMRYYGRRFSIAFFCGFFRGGCFFVQENIR